MKKNASKLTLVASESKIEQVNVTYSVSCMFSQNSTVVGNRIEAEHSNTEDDKIATQTHEWVEELDEATA